MRVTVDVAGGGTHEITVGPDERYADLLDAVGLSPQEATVLLDGRPVPEDRFVNAERVRVLRLVRGG